MGRQKLKGALFLLTRLIIKYAISKNSLAFVEAESIIPEWLFKTTIMIDSERIEFKNDTKFGAVDYSLGLL